MSEKILAFALEAEKEVQGAIQEPKRQHAIFSELFGQDGVQEKEEYEEICSDDYIEISYDYEDKEVFMALVGYNGDGCYIKPEDLLMVSETIAKAAKRMAEIKSAEKDNE